MPKYKIITCDLCGDRIYNSGPFEMRFEDSVKISARVLKKDFGAMDKDRTVFMYPGWRRQKYYICTKCLNALRKYCLTHMGGADDD